MPLLRLTTVNASPAVALREAATSANGVVGAATLAVTAVSAALAEVTVPCEFVTTTRYCAPSSASVTGGVT